MKSWQRATLTTFAVTALALTTAGPSLGAPAPAKDTSSGYTFAVIGDIPYGPAQIANFPNVIAQINADPAVRWVDHLGDIKNGSSVCSDEYFQQIKHDFDLFADPFVYTIGDNEWTDCHRANNGSYNPLERLAKVREVFFPTPGQTLGQQAVPVTSQTDRGIPENVSWERADVSFAAVHIVGSNNSLAPWTGQSAPTPEQAAEVLDRTSAAIDQITSAFATAHRHHDRAVSLLIQADMFDPTVADPQYADYYGFTPIVAALARESARFHGHVYLFNGDSHVYDSDNPLASGSKWLSFYKLTQPVPNLSRVTVDGSTDVDDYLRVTVHPHGAQVLTWTRVPFAS